MCIHNDAALPDIFKPGYIDLQAFAKKSTKGAFKRKLNRLFKHGYLLDVTVIQECVERNVGLLTFEVAPLAFV